MQHPAVITVTGISNSGKTWNIVTLITRGYLKTKPKKFVLFIEHKQKLQYELESLAPVEYNYAIPSSLEEADLETSQRVCVLIDDHFQTTKNSKFISDLYTKVAHHCDITVINLTQNAYCGGMQNRTQIKNTGYFVMTKSLGAVDNFDKLAEHSLAKRHRTTFTDVCLNLTRKADSFIVLKNTKDVEYLNERLFYCGDNWKEKKPPRTR